MTLTRRTFLAALPVLAAGPTFAQDPPEPLTTYERDTGGRIGVYAENTVTGATLGWRARELFVMCSTFKFSLAAFVLASVDRRVLRLDDMIPYGASDIQDYAPVAKKNLEHGAMSVADMCEAAVELSDNTCANMLLARLGGPQALTGFWRATGDPTSRLDHNEPELNRSPPGNPHDATTPEAMAGNLRRFVLGDVLTPPSRERLIGWIVNCKTGGDRLRGGLPPDWAIGDKTGNNGKDGFGDVAVAWPKPGRPILISAYTQGGTPTPTQVRTVFGDIGRIVGQRLA